MFYNSAKILDITSAGEFLFLQKKALEDSIQNNCLKQLFGKLRERPAGLHQKDSRINVTRKFPNFFRPVSENSNRFY